MIYPIKNYLEKIDTIGALYDEFTPNSFLTHNQLNKLSAYFEDSDRIRTIALHGVGIVCGLQIKTFNNGSGITNRIDLTPGIFVTTDGDTIAIDDFKKFEYYLPFNNRSGYNRLQGKNIYELYQQEDVDSLQGELPLSSLGSSTNNFKDYIVVLFLDQYKVDPGLCSANSCDDTGNHYHNDVKALLVPNDVWEKNLMTEDTIFENHNLWGFHANLQNFVVERAVVNKSNNSSTSLLHNLFSQKITNPLDLAKSYKLILDEFDSRIDLRFLQIDKTQIISKFNVLFGNYNSRLDVQYQYDLFKELIETYNEIKDLILFLNVDCNPNRTSFPKHISVGKVKAPDNLSFRHRFVFSALHKDKQENLYKFRSLLVRFWNQLDYSFSSGTIKITPSKTFSFPIDERAIPYYYNFGKINSTWNFQKNQIGKSASNYGYKNNNAFTDISVSHLDKGFLRIEGHLGVPYNLALSTINKLKQDKGLCFDVKVVSIHSGLENINWNDYACEFSDLELLLKTWEVDYKCKIKGFEEYFGNLTYDRQVFSQATILLKEASTAKTSAEFASTDPNRFKLNEAILPILETKADNCNAFEAVKTNFGAISMPSSTFDAHFGFNAQIFISLHGLLKDTRPWTAFLNDQNYLDLIKSKISNFCENKERMHRALQEYLTSLQQENKEGTRWNIYETIAVYSQLKDVCCYVSKLNWLQEEINRRKKSILSKLTLENITKKHPGAEHMAGVPYGGTLLLVYAGKTKEINAFGKPNNVILADFALPYMCCSDCAPTQVVQIPTPIETEPTYAITNPADQKICENKSFVLTTTKDGTNYPLNGIIEFPNGTSINYTSNSEINFEKYLAEISSEINPVPLKFKFQDYDLEYKLIVNRAVQIQFSVDKNTAGIYFFNNKTADFYCENLVYTKNNSEPVKIENNEFRIHLENGEKIKIRCLDEKSCSIPFEYQAKNKKSPDKEWFIKSISNNIQEIVKELQKKRPKEGTLFYEYKQALTSILEKIEKGPEEYISFYENNFSLKVYEIIEKVKGKLGKSEQDYLNINLKICFELMRAFDDSEIAKYVKPTAKKMLMLFEKYVQYFSSETINYIQNLDFFSSKASDIRNQYVDLYKESKV